MRNEGWRFECNEEDTDAHNTVGVAKVGNKTTVFCVGGDASVARLIVDPTPTGLELVREVEQEVGLSTFLYMFDCGWVKVYIAEWHCHGNRARLDQRIDQLKQGKVSSDLQGRVAFLHRRCNHVI